MLGSYTRTRRIGARQAWEDVSGVLDMFPELARLLDQKAGTLSGGQQQMVALARGMAAQPRVLLLDEPCLGLAEAVARRVYDWLGEMTKTDMTILLVEENPVHAVLVADRAVRMYKGLVEQPGVARAMSEFLNLLAAGLTSGAIYGIFGACLAVWFRVCNVLNLAVGDFAMFGAIGSAWLVQTAGLPFIVGIIVVLRAWG